MLDTDVRRGGLCCRFAFQLISKVFFSGDEVSVMMDQVWISYFKLKTITMLQHTKIYSVRQQFVLDTYMGVMVTTWWLYTLAILCRYFTVQRSHAPRCIVIDVNFITSALLSQYENISKNFSNKSIQC